MSAGTGERGDLSLWAGIGLPAAPLWLAAAPATAGAATGDGEIIHPATGAPLDSGGSATTYGVALPAGASCPGDTAHDGYHVYSYLVPAGHTPTEVSLHEGVPEPLVGFISYGAYYGAVNTAEDTGQVMTLPQFSWSRYSSYLNDLFPTAPDRPPGRAGSLCANSTARSPTTGTPRSSSPDLVRPGGLHLAGGGTRRRRRTTRGRSSA